MLALSSFVGAIRIEKQTCPGTDLFPVPQAFDTTAVVVSGAGEIESQTVPIDEQSINDASFSLGSRS